MAEVKFVNLKNLPVKTSEEITSEIKKFKSLEEQRDANEKESDRLESCNYLIEQDMVNILKNFCVFSVEVKYVSGRMMFSDLSEANKLYQVFLEKGIPKSNVIVEYNDEYIYDEDDLSKINVSFDLNAAQDFVTDTYDKWFEEVQKRAPKKTKWDFADI
jgi:hypothetical protein